MKKINFSFLDPHFSPINEKLKKTENENFSFSVPPIVTYYSVWVAHAFLDQTSTNGHGLLLSVGCSCYFGSNQYKWVISI